MFQVNSHSLLGANQHHAVEILESVISQPRTYPHLVCEQPLHVLTLTLLF